MRKLWNKFIGWATGGIVKDTIASIDLGVAFEAIVARENQDASAPGPLKKEDVIVYLLAAVDIPYLPKKIEALIWSAIIDKIVNVLNNLMWKKKETKAVATSGSIESHTEEDA